MMKISQALRDPITWEKHALTDAQKALDSALFYILTNCTEGKAADTLLNVPEGHGCEAWRRYAKTNEPKALSHSRPRLMKWLATKAVCVEISRADATLSEVGSRP